jgi:hypothetical protein
MKRPTTVVQLLFPGLVGLLLLSGCGKESSHPTTETHSAGPSNQPPAPNLVGPGKDEKVCFQCNGQGSGVCRASGCQGGKVDCSSSCLKLTRGSWIRMNVAGHDPSELWMKFPDQDGQGSHSFSRAHVGEAIVYQNGIAVSTGPCKICGGTTKVACRSCGGTGKQTCEICRGKKFVPVGWTANDNPWLNSQPDVIRLKQGSPIFGKVVLTRGDDLTIRTREGKFIHVNASEVVTPVAASQ